MKNETELSALETLCQQTYTKPEDWEELDGPESGNGVDYWFVNVHSGREVYVNDDQGNITVDLSMGVDS
jgi:hypothetical protein